MSLSTSIESFRKGISCPLSTDLLKYQTCTLSKCKCEKIVLHFEFCEFCESEAEFYGHFPQIEETVEVIDIPSHLRDLADAFLNNGCKDKTLLNRVLNEAEELRLLCN